MKRCDQREPTASWNPLQMPRCIRSPVPQVLAPPKPLHSDFLSIALQVAHLKSVPKIFQLFPFCILDLVHRAPTRSLRALLLSRCWSKAATASICFSTIAPLPRLYLKYGTAAIVISRLAAASVLCKLIFVPTCISSTVRLSSLGALSRLE